MRGKSWISSNINISILSPLLSCSRPTGHCPAGPAQAANAARPAPRTACPRTHDRAEAPGRASDWRGGPSGRGRNGGVFSGWRRGPAQRRGQWGGLTCTFRDAGAHRLEAETRPDAQHAAGSGRRRGLGARSRLERWPLALARLTRGGRGHASWPCEWTLPGLPPPAGS